MDNIYTKEKLIIGINKTCEAIEGTYGAGGGNAIVESDLFPFHICTNDGKSIVDAIKLTDPVENIGANIIKEVGNKADKDSGDGRKTTMILTKAILAQPFDCSPMEAKQSLDSCLSIILKSIDDQTRAIEPESVGQVATIASESEALGSLFQEIYTKIGKDGIVELDVSNLPETSYEITEGVRLRNAGFMYEYMTNDGKEKVGTYLAPKVLITKEKISGMNILGKIMESLDKNGIHEMVIFCDDIDVKISQILAYKHMGTTPQGQPIPAFKALVIKAPTLWKDWLFEDFAKITGATIIDPIQGTSLKNFKFEYLGTCDKIVSRADETTVIGIHDISTHIEKLKELGTDEGKIRLAWLQTKAAILKVGAHSETELKYLSLKARDARNASFLAMQGGVVAGGGVAYLNAIENLPSTVGGKILSKVLFAPINQIHINMGLKERVDKFADNIVDPAIITKNSITNAISVAGMVLTAQKVITIK